MLHQIERPRVQGSLPAPDRHEQPEDPHIERLLERPAIPEVPAVDRRPVQSPTVRDNTLVSRPGPEVPQIVERVNSVAPEVPQLAQREPVVAPVVPELPLREKIAPLPVPELPGMHIQRGEPQPPPTIEQPDPANPYYPPELNRRYDIATHRVHWM